MNRYEKVKETLERLYSNKQAGITASEIAEAIGYDRSNVSRELNQLVKNGECRKRKSRPVLFFPNTTYGKADEFVGELSNITKLDQFSEQNPSLTKQIEQGKAAILYPPYGMHMLLLGDTGVGKSMFAELLYQYGIESGKLGQAASFIQFNCADYASNPQLLVGTLFGVAKGAYTGAEQRIGLLEQADGGVLFLDEIHRLPPEGQEMLFSYIDRGLFKPLGESVVEKKVNVLLIGATTENREVLLATLIRRIPMTITLPSLADRTVDERLQLFDLFVAKEVAKLNLPLKVSIDALKAFLSYPCEGNIGQFKSDIKVVLAKTYAEYLTGKQAEIMITTAGLPEYIKQETILGQGQRELWAKLDSTGTRFHEYHPKNSSGQIKRRAIYAEIDRKYHDLEMSNMSMEDIQRAMELDWTIYFNKHAHQNSNNNFLSFIPPDLLKVINEMIRESERLLKRSFSEKIVQALTIHIYNMIERITHNHELEDQQQFSGIKDVHPELWSVAERSKLFLESRLNISIPEIEIGYLTIFFSYDIMNEELSNQTIQVLVIAHGEGLATALSNTANELLRSPCTIGIDARLDQTPQEVLAEVKTFIRNNHITQDVLLLVDMGSLTNFSTELEKEFQFRSRSIPLVSTMHVMEAGRKAMLGYSLDEVYQDTLKVNEYSKMIVEQQPVIPKTTKQLAIISVCLTGEGTALTIKQILEDELHLAEQGVEVITINYIGQETIAYRINELKEQYRIACVVSSFPIDVEIPVFDLHSILNEDGLIKVEECLKEEITYQKMTQTIKKYYQIDKIDEIVNSIYILNEEIERLLNQRFTSSELIGISFHIIGMLLKNQQGLAIQKIEDEEGILQANPEFRSRIHQLFRKYFEQYFLNLTADMMDYVVFSYLK